WRVDGPGRQMRQTVERGLAAGVHETRVRDGLKPRRIHQAAIAALGPREGRGIKGSCKLHVLSVLHPEDGMGEPVRPDWPRRRGSTVTHGRANFRSLTPQGSLAGCAHSLS